MIVFSVFDKRVNMINKLRIIISDVKEGENIDLYLIVLISIPLAILNLLGIALTASGPVILSVLTLLAISTLVNRRKLESLVTKVNQTVDDVLLKELPENWTKDLIIAKDIWIIGINLARTITTYYPLLQEKINKNAKIKLILVSPDGYSQSILTKRIIRSVADDSNRAIILSSLTDLCKLKEIAPGNVEIRTIDFPPPFGVFGMDVDSPEGVIYIESYPFKSKHDDIPVMVFHQKEKFWYDFYYQQILSLWENSKEWQYPNIKQ